MRYQALFILFITLSTEVFYICCISYLVAATGLQSIWSFSLAVVDIYALLVGRLLQNYRVVVLFAMGDGVRYVYQVVSWTKNRGSPFDLIYVCIFLS